MEIFKIVIIVLIVLMVVYAFLHWLTKNQTGQLPDYKNPPPPPPKIKESHILNSRDTVVSIYRNLDFQDLIALIMSTQPTNEQLEDPKIRDLGYLGIGNIYWFWEKSKFQNIALPDMWKLYLTLKR